MKKKAGLEVLSLGIVPEAEEAVSAILETIFQQSPTFHHDFRTGRFVARVYFKSADHPSMETLKRLRSELRRLRESGVETGACRVTLKPVRDLDWAESWKRHFKPLHISNRLRIRPPWSRPTQRAGQREVILDPGLSFGTGQHATTSFCLKRLDGARNDFPKPSLLDIGTGSGILAIAAAKLGYCPVAAFDFDPQAVRTCLDNANRNGVARQIKIFQADLTAWKAPRRYEVICANLIDDLLVAEASRLLKCLAPRGRLILAGILIKQFPRVERTFQRLGLRLVACRVEKEWKSGEFIQPS